MKVFRRICIKSAYIEAQNGDRQEIIRGQEYTTDREKDGKVLVFAQFWVPFPAEYFAGAEELGKREEMVNAYEDRERGS